MGIVFFIPRYHKLDKGERREGVQKAWPRDQAIMADADIIKYLAMGEGRGVCATLRGVGCVLKKGDVLVLKEDNTLVLKKDSIWVSKKDNVLVLKKDNVLVLKKDNVLVLKKDNIFVLKQRQCLGFEE